MGSYGEYFGNMSRNISRMVPHISNDLTPNSLASFFIIHTLSFKKIIFLKDNNYFVKDVKVDFCLTVINSPQYGGQPRAKIP